MLHSGLVGHITKGREPWNLVPKKKDCEYILKWVPELKNVLIKDIHNWFKSDINEKYKDINYPKPMIIHDEERLETIKLYKEGLK